SRLKNGAWHPDNCESYELFRCQALYYPQISFAVSATNFSFAHCSSSVRMFPWCVDAKPHCGLMHSCSSGTYFDASSTRSLIVSLFSNLPVLEVTNPKTTLGPPFGIYLRGSNDPERSSSYSRKKPSTFSFAKIIGAISS